MFEIINEHRKNISLILTMTWTDLVRTYKGSKLGWFWAILKPSFKIAIYYFMLAIGLKASKDMFGFPYFLWLVVGIIPWFYINDMLFQGSESIRKYSYLVTKMKFPISTTRRKNVFVLCMTVLISRYAPAMLKTAATE